MPYLRNDPATSDLVRKYLADNYTETDGSPLSGDDLDALVETYDALAAESISSGAHAKDVGDRIAANAGLLAVTTHDDENLDESADHGGSDAEVTAGG